MNNNNTVDKVILDIETCKNLERMIKSNDPENQVVALKCLENADIKNSLVNILFLFKGASLKEEILAENSPKLLKVLKKYSSKFPSITFADICKIVETSGDDQKEYFLNELTILMKKSAKLLGADMIDKLDFKITFKE